MAKETDFARLAGLRLMTVEDDAAAIIEYLTTGRIDLAKQFAIAIAENVKKAQKDLSAAVKQ